MKQLRMNTILLCAVAIMGLSACAQQDAKTMLSNDTQRQEVISAIVADDQFSAQLIDSLLVRQHGQVMSKMDAMMGGEDMMSNDMMRKMMDKCKTDTTMCRMMMDKTMDMCDADSSTCKMMMGSMSSRPNVMKSMQGMCDMKNMKTGQKK